MRVVTKTWTGRQMKEFATGAQFKQLSRCRESLTTETAAIAMGELAHCLKRRVFLPTCSAPFSVYPGDMEILQ